MMHKTLGILWLAACNSLLLPQLQLSFVQQLMFAYRSFSEKNVWMPNFSKNRFLKLIIIALLIRAVTFERRGNRFSGIE